MEHTDRTRKTGVFNVTKARISKAVILVIMTFLISRAPLMGESFPAAAALISCMVSWNSFNIYLVLPAAAGMLPFAARGYDIWGDLAAVCLCGLVFSAMRGVRIELWQRAVCAAAINIICVSMYRLMSATAYRISATDLLTEGAVVFGAVFVFSSLRETLQSRGKSRAGTGSDEYLPLMSLGAVCLMMIKGLGIDFIIWPFVMILALWALTSGDTGRSLVITASSGAAAALLGQQQWGLLATVMMGIICASFMKRCGPAVTALAFAAACAVIKGAGSGAVLGADGYCLFLGTAGFMILNWKAGAFLERVMGRFSKDPGERAFTEIKAAEKALRRSGRAAGELAELYGTYMDSRSAIATQLAITEQIIENTACSMKNRVSGAYREEESSGRFILDIASSQCAAAGTINGDCCGWEDIGDGRTAMVISDGMGKGKKAAAESLLVTKTVMALLRSGAGVDLILRMINEVMLMKDDDDSFATVDLMIADTRTGSARFYKTGAAPTLIRRKGRVEEVRLSAVPLGIVNGLKIKYVEVSLKKGDWIIMMSDGVSDGGDGMGLAAIKDTVGGVRSENPKTMCDLILNRASDSYIGKERDDLTVMAARILRR